MTTSARHVLLVEDDVNLAEAIAGLLGDDGFVVDQRHDGESGLAAGLEGDYDLVVLDVMLPKKNGFAVCGELRAHGVSAPLLMLTAKVGELDEVEGLDAGADDFLRKPFEAAVLRARVAALLRRHDRDRSTELVVGDTTLDLVHRIMRTEAGETTLTSREFSLLEQLLSASPRPVTREDLMRTSWGPDFDGDPNILEVYIGYLRKKFVAVASNATIKTIRGLGYCVVIE